MTAFVGISPAIASDDVFDHVEPLLTNFGNAVTFTRDGTDLITGFTGLFTANVTERFLVKLFDQSEGDWHVQSGPNGFWVLVNSGKIAPFSRFGEQTESGLGIHRRPIYVEINGQPIQVRTAQEARDLIAQHRPSPPPPPPPREPPRMQYKILKAG